ncbi:MAG: excinuclease ABC subunit UvrC [Clostridia bacterium]|nr:excinuclease ABC subunit UvrC [Clostridia bacterium]
MNPNMKQLRKKAMSLPLLPGVYIMKDKSDKIIYIGKAKKLKNRVSQYFGSQNNHPVKVLKMVENVDHFDYIVTDSEFEALVLEASLIKQNKPKYNILLKDDKGYSYIRISGDKYKKLEAVLQKYDDGAKYLGPYTSSYSVKQSVDTANKIFKLYTCNKSFPRDFRKTRPCLNYYISQCCGVCTGRISEEEYSESFEQALKFLKGDTESVLKELQEKMVEASENLEFENAAKYRDKIKAVKNMQVKQKVIYKSVEQQDVFATAEHDDTICLVVLRFDNGRLYDSEHFFFESSEESAEIQRSNYITSFYGMRNNIPKQITLDGEAEDSELLERWLTQKRGKKVNIAVPQKGEQAQLVNMCRENAIDKLALYKGKSGKTVAVLEELRELLGLKNSPDYIESYDISHTAGSDSVGGMVVFKDGKPFKQAYKRFAIKGFANDDYGSMNEVLDRRFNEYFKNKDSGEGFGRLPDLILLDGGVGQVNAVMPLLEKYKLDVPVFGMVKDSKHRTRAIAQNGGEIAINSKRQVFTFVSQIQDEVHRYSIAYHHKKHAKSNLSLSLTQIEGVGEKKAKALLKHFKTIKAIKNASVEELCEAQGISEKIAEKIYNFYRTGD